MKEKTKTKKPRKLYYTEKPSRLPGCKMSCGVTLSNLMTFLNEYFMMFKKIYIYCVYIMYYIYFCIFLINNGYSVVIAFYDIILIDFSVFKLFSEMVKKKSDLYETKNKYVPLVSLNGLWWSFFFIRFGALDLLIVWYGPGRSCSSCISVVSRFHHSWRGTFRR